MSFEEQIMSKDKYPNISSREIEAIVFIILLFATRAVCGISLGLIHDVGLHNIEITCAV